jgi:hypothetical protein
LAPLLDPHPIALVYKGSLLFRGKNSTLRSSFKWLKTQGDHILGGGAMIKKLLHEELYIHIDKEKLARLLGADPGFAVQNVEEERNEIRFMLFRKTTLDETNANARNSDQEGFL